MSDRQDRGRQFAEVQREKTGARAQIHPRFILGIFAFIVLAGPLAVFAIEFQSALASTPAFTWFSGGVIALLFVVAVFAAAVGLE